jgi:S1-C subfamily serine protease
VRERLGLKQERGVLLVDVQPGSAAATASLRPLDIVVSIGDTPVTAVEDLKRRIDSLRAGRNVEVAFLREGRLRRTHVVIGGMPRGIVEARL